MKGRVRENERYCEAYVVSRLPSRIKPELNFGGGTFCEQVTRHKCIRIVSVSVNEHVFVHPIYIPSSSGR